MKGEEDQIFGYSSERIGGGGDQQELKGSGSGSQ